MTTKIVAGALLIVALAAMGTVGVSYFSDYSYGAPNTSAGATDTPSLECEIGTGHGLGYTVEPKPCCNMPTRDELIKCGGVIGKPEADNKNAGD